MSKPTRKYVSPEPNSPPSIACLAVGVIAAVMLAAVINAVIVAFQRYPGEARFVAVIIIACLALYGAKNTFDL